MPLTDGQRDTLRFIVGRDSVRREGDLTDPAVGARLATNSKLVETITTVLAKPRMPRNVVDGARMDL